MNHTIQIATLNAHARVDPDLLDSEYDAQYYLSETKPEFAKMLRACGLYVDDTGTMLHYDPDHFAEIRAACDAIIDEYDHSDDKPTWDYFDLHGDDDVDYHGGYITSVLDALTSYTSTTGATQ